MLNFKANDIPAHLTICPKVKVSCNYCNNAVLREYLSKHENTDCPAVPISCSFLTYGCTEKFLRKELSHHLNLFVSAHVLLVADFYQKQIQKLSEVVAHQKEIIDSLTTTFPIDNDRGILSWLSSLPPSIQPLSVNTHLGRDVQEEYTLTTTGNRNKYRSQLGNRQRHVLTEEGIELTLKNRKIKCSYIGINGNENQPRVWEGNRDNPVELTCTRVSKINGKPTSYTYLYKIENSSFVKYLKVACSRGSVPPTNVEFYGVLLKE